MFLLCVTGRAFAQDVIVMKDQSTVISKVLEITSTEIKYKKWSNQDGPTYTIDRTDVVCINYENGEVEKFQDAIQEKAQNNPISQQNTYSQQVQYPYFGKMERAGASLSINGQKLSQGEIQILLGEQNYQLYKKGKEVVHSGQAVGIVGLVVLTAAEIYTEVRNSDQEIKNMRPLKLGLAYFGVSSAACILLCIYGGKSIDRVVNEFNNSHGYYSLSISPSLLKLEAPQSQGNYGLGLTLNMNF